MRRADIPPVSDHPQWPGPSLSVSGPQFLFSEEERPLRVTAFRPWTLSAFA